MNIFKLHHNGNVSATRRTFVLFATQTGWASSIFSVLIRTDQNLKINKIVVKEGDRIEPQNQGIPHTDSVKNGNDY